MRFSKQQLSPDPIPPGVYVAKIDSAREARSRSGHPMLVVGLRLEGDQTELELADFIVTAGVNSKALAAATERLKALCAACGLTLIPDEDFDPERLVGQKLKAV